MTKSQRAQVVELLRCAADWAARGNTVWLDSIAVELDADDVTREWSRDVGNYVTGLEPFASERARCERSVMPPEWSKRVALTAAVLIEEGSYP